MMKQFHKIALIAIGGLLSLNALAQVPVGQIKGEILDEERQPVIGATVKVTRDGILIGGTAADVEGHYTYKPLNPGFYEVTVMAIGYPTYTRKEVEVEPDKTSYVDFKMSVNTLTTVVVEETYVKPIVDNNVYTMHSLDANDFLHLAAPRGDVKAAVVAIASEVSEDADGELHIRGSRGNATEYVVDGIRCMDMNGIPALAVDNVSVITGGIPAQYGDLTSGVIVVTTKDYFSGIRSKHMRENYYREQWAQEKREKDAKQLEQKRLKEIEDAKKKEAEEKKLTD